MALARIQIHCYGRVALLKVLSGLHVRRFAPKRQPTRELPIRRHARKGRTAVGCLQLCQPGAGHAKSGDSSDVSQGRVRRARKRISGRQQMSPNLSFSHKIVVPGENLSRAVTFSAAC